MLKYYPATVAAKRRETADSVIITLAAPTEAADEFAYSHGQHLPVRAHVDGEELRRTYSICSSVDDRRLRLGVRVQGRVSGYLADTLDVGDKLDVMPPTGHFQTELDPAEGKTYAAFVAGSGITPVLSIVKTVLETEPDSRCVLFYGNRKRSTTMFVEELWGLKNLYPQRLALHFLLSREDTEIPLYSGRIDAEKTRALHEAFLAGKRPDDTFVCGPDDMIDAVRGTLIELGYDEHAIHSERFRVARTEAAPEAVQADSDQQTSQTDGGVRVTVVMDGHRQTFEMEDDEQTLLDAGLDEGLDLPYSCMGGVCSTCRTLLAKGKVEMEVNQALEDWEIEEGYILACQSRPLTGEIEIDYDQA